MATSLSVTACLNLSQARPLLLRRVIRSLLRGLVGGLDGVALEGLDMFTLEVFAMDDYLAIAGGMNGLVLLTTSLDKPCLDFYCLNS